MADNISVEIVFALPEQQYLLTLSIPNQISIQEAIEYSGLLDTIKQDYPQFSASILSYGIWGKKKAANTIVQDGDRIEIYRPLLVDPKENRRIRALKEAKKCQKKSN